MSKKYYNILLIGTGMMGKRLLRYLKKDAKYKITNLDFLHFTIFDKELLELIKFDFIIDFSHPRSSEVLSLIKWRGNPKFIIGTTGYSESQKELLKQLALKYLVVWDNNFSIGIKVLENIIFQNQKILKEYKLSLAEIHHQDKLDRPSGTALALKECLKQNNYPSDVKIKVLREGDELGTHKIIFEDANEVITFSHQVKDRELFLKGIDKTMAFLVNKKSGLYSFRDVLEGEF